MCLENNLTALHCLVINRKPFKRCMDLKAEGDTIRTEGLPGGILPSTTSLSQSTCLQQFPNAPLISPPNNFTSKSVSPEFWQFDSSKIELSAFRDSNSIEESWTSFADWNSFTKKRSCSEPVVSVFFFFLLSSLFSLPFRFAILPSSLTLSHRVALITHKLSWVELSWVGPSINPLQCAWALPQSFFFPPPTIHFFSQLATIKTIIYNDQKIH